MVAAILLVTGYEENLYPITRDVDVTLLPLYNTNLLDRWITSLRRLYFVDNIYVVTFSEKKEVIDVVKNIKKRDPQINLITLDSVVGSAYATAMALREVCEDFTMICFSNTFIRDYSPLLEEYGKGFEKDRVYMLVNYTMNSLPEEWLINETKKKVEKTKGGEEGFIFSGILLGSRYFLYRLFKRTKLNEESSEFKIRDTLEIVLNEGRYCFIDGAMAVKINTPDKYFYVLDNYSSVLLKEKVEPKVYLEGKTFGPVYIGENSIVEEGVKIRGPAYIGKNVIIREGTSLRKNVIICDNCCVGTDNSISESVILTGCKIDDLAVIRRSIVGKNVSIGNLVSVGAGFTSKGVTLIGSDVKIFDNSVIVGGVKIGKNSTIYYNSVCDRDLSPNTLFPSQNI